MLALTVRFDLRDAAAAEEFDRLTNTVVKQIQQHEPGTLVYVTGTVADAPLGRVFFEVYRDQAAKEEHERQPHVRQFHAAKAPLLAAKRVEILTPGAAKGLPA
jgi:quinol monooxygenase YgiN